MTYIKLNTLIQGLNILLISKNEPVNVLTFKSINHYVHIELQLANLPLLIYLRSSQSITSFVCTKKLIVSLYTLFQYKILSLIQIFIHQSFRNNVVGLRLSVFAKALRKEGLRSAALVAKSKAMINRLAKLSQQGMDGDSKPETVKTYYCRALIQSLRISNDIEPEIPGMIH
jgi:hypothetical protein